MKPLIAFFCLLSLGLKAQPVFTEQEYEPGHFSLSEARGVAVADFDNDGDQDFFISGQTCGLFRNDGDFQFTNISSAANLVGIQARTSVWVDIDNDGLLDLVTSSWDEARIYMNNGDATFRAGKSIPVKKRNLIMAGDLNGDGWPDLFSSNFQNYSELLLNKGDGGFADLSHEGKIMVSSNGMGGLLTDMDTDGDLDIYVTYDGQQAAEVYLNDGHGIFSEQAASFGLNLESNAMGVDYADFNRDGKLDFYITNLYENYLLIQQPDGTFLETGKNAGVDDIGMGWGVRCADFDNDGHSDIYINNEYEYSPHENHLYWNTGTMEFADVTDAALANFESGYGTASADFNNDGFLDLIVVNDTPERSVRIFRNTTANNNHWLQLQLVSATSDKYAIGARAEVYINGTVVLDQVTAGSGWASQNGYRLHVGLGSAQGVDSLLVHWPDGSTEKHVNLLINTRYLVLQNSMPDVFQVDNWNAQVRRQPSIQLPDIRESLLPDPELSMARQWNEMLLQAIRTDFARPTVHARNLFHLSVAMYDAWAAYGGNTFVLGKRFGGMDFPFEGVPLPEDVEAARNEAISYAAYRLMKHRFSNSPGADQLMPLLDELMERNGYQTAYSGSMYTEGTPAALGNYIAQQLILFGLQDGSNEGNGYVNEYYMPVNNPFEPSSGGNGDMTDPNRWQPLSFVIFIDQSGNELSSTPEFLGAEWGNVIPFALPGTEMTGKSRDGNDYKVYLDPGAPPQMTNTNGLEDSYKWHHTMVSVWSSHLDYHDGVMLDISPNSMGNNGELPQSEAERKEFYNYLEGGDHSMGYEANQVTGLPYEVQMVRRGDFARVLAEFWADGPDSETPPGHWFTLLNYVQDHPAFERKFKGEGEELSPLEWDVKAYLTLGGAMHDAAIAAWSVKGYYDYIRPISAIRYMAGKGQSSDPSLPNYNPEGIPLIEGYVELVEPGDPLAGPGNEHVNEIKLYTWLGHNNLRPDGTAGVGWVLGRNWISYQRSTFVTPPFAGYVSGHSTFSRAAAEVLSLLTGSEFFPGGMGEFVARQNDFLVFETGPSADVRLQWARYQDAADQSALSRIWGGIHPPADDIPGRIMGISIGHYAFEKAARIFNDEMVTGVPDIESNVPIIYPNPAHSGSSIFVSIASGSAITRIRDISGRLIHAGKTGTTGVLRIDLPQLQSGLYFVEIILNGNRSVHKLIIRD